MEQKHDCIFDKIIRGEIPAVFQYQDEDFVVFNDIAPAAEIHWVIVPRMPLRDLNDLYEQGKIQILEKLGKLLKHLGKKAGYDESYRLVTNCGAEAGQTVFHLHFHFLAGPSLKTENAVSPK